MSDFTNILNKGIRRHIDKNMKKRKFGKCDNCDRHTLLIDFTDEKEQDVIWHICEFCYANFLDDTEIK